jgi:uridine kinase
VIGPHDGRHRGGRVSNTLCIGVAGGTGSGKTTVTDRIRDAVGAHRMVILHQDRYYRDLSHLDPASRQARNFDHPDALEAELLVEHLERLRHGLPTDLPVYDFANHVRRSEVERVEPRPVLLVEGILILAIASLRELLDIKIYVDTDADLRFIRRLQRDIRDRERTLAGVVEQYLATVRPMHLEFVEPSRRWADIIIPEGGHNRVALELVTSRIERGLEGHDES